MATHCQDSSNGRKEEEDERGGGRQGQGQECHLAPGPGQCKSTGEFKDTNTHSVHTVVQIC